MNISISFYCMEDHDLDYIGMNLYIGSNWISQEEVNPGDTYEWITKVYTTADFGTSLTVGDFENANVKVLMTKYDMPHIAGIKVSFGYYDEEVINSDYYPENNPNSGTNDPDQDGLDNTNEYIHNTDPHDSDSDNDGMPDGWEILYNFDPDNSSDGSLDWDGDYLTNSDEFLNYVDPTDTDSDEDTLNDGGEVNGTYRYVSLPYSSDSDGDGLTDLEEYNGINGYYPHPMYVDSDNDYLDDELELMTYATDPWDSDWDNDGLMDGHEVFWYFTGVKDSDSDNDGLSDGLEINTLSSNPNNEDTDGDDYSDGLEYTLKNSYGISCSLTTSQSDILVSTHGSSTSLSLSYNYVLTKTHSYIYTCLRYESDYYLKTRRDDRYGGTHYMYINNYARLSVLNYYDCIKGVRVYYRVKGVSENTNSKQLKDLRVQVHTQDGTVSGWQYIKSGEISYGTWYDSYKTFTASGVLQDVYYGGYIKKIETRATITGNYLKRWTDYYLDHMQVTYVFSEDC